MIKIWVCVILLFLSGCSLNLDQMVIEELIDRVELIYRSGYYRRAYNESLREGWREEEKNLRHFLNQRIKR